MTTPLVEPLAQEIDSDEPFAGLDENCYLEQAQDLDFAHTSWQHFKEDLTSVCTNLFPRIIPEYALVHVILLNWLEDDLGTIDELMKLEKLFKDWFGYSTEVWRIPSSQQAERELDQKLTIVTGQYRGEHDLLIVYYGGHGEEDPNHQSIWRANLQHKSPKLNWSSLQPTLLRAPCDVLILLDCCYAGAAARSNVIGTNELLAACVREELAIGVCPISFTEMVMRKIRTFGLQPFTIADLYQRLLKDRKRLKKTPQHYPFSSRDGRKLTLKPRQSVMTEVDQSSRIDASVLSSSTSHVYASNSLWRAEPSSSTILPSLEYPRILLAISLRPDAVIPDIESCTRWLAVEAPLEILKVDVRIESAYEAHSTLIFFSMPVQVWTYLPKVAAYRFIDFICSDNLLQQVESEPWDEGILPDSVTTTSVSVFVEGKYLPMVERQERMDLDTYVKGDAGIVTTRYPQTLYDVRELHSARDLYAVCRLDSARDFRLLSLQPGNFVDPIHCTLLVWSMTDIMSGDNAVPYEVISHSCGPADSMIIIYTSGMTSYTSLKVSCELYEAFLKLRDQRNHRHFWVDTICINSEDMNEKNSHIALMPNIFHHASNVGIFLGPDCSDNCAMDFITSLHDRDDSWDVVYYCTPEELEALDSLMKQKWFCNRWTLQLLALAREATLYCGAAQVDLFDLATAVSLFRLAKSDFFIPQLKMHKIAPGISDLLNNIDLRHAVRLLDIVNNLFRKDESRQILGGCLSLEDLVCQSSGLHSTTPHDVIYSVLALANDAVPVPVDLHKPILERPMPPKSEEKVFIVDYDKPFLDVCKDFLMHTIRISKSLDIICRPWVQRDSFNEREKPSWLLTTEQAAYAVKPNGKYGRVYADTLVGPAGLGKRNYSASGQFKVPRVR